jgi:hypothetical protein
MGNYKNQIYKPVVGETGWDDGVNTNFDRLAEVIVGNALSPDAITGDQNDYNPAGLVDATVVRISSNDIWTITGVATGANGRLVRFWNIGAFDIILSNENTLSSAANRLHLPGGVNLRIRPDSATTLVYDVVTSRWRVADLGPTGRIPAPFILSDTLNPAQITSDQNNYNPTGLATATYIFVNADAPHNITGLKAQEFGRIIIFHNSGDQVITLKHSDVGSTFGNRFDLSGSVDAILTSRDSIILRYNTTQFWEEVSRTSVGVTFNDSAGGAPLGLVSMTGVAIWPSRRDHVHPIGGVASYGDGSDGSIAFDGTNLFSTFSTFTSTQKLTNNQQSLEGGTTGWAANNNCTIARSTAQAFVGVASLSCTTNGSAGDMSARTLTGTSGFTVAPGTTYAVSGYIRSAATVRDFMFNVAWYDSVGTLISTDVGTSASGETTSGWTFFTRTATAPAGAAFAAIFPTWVGNGSTTGEVHYIDAISVTATTYTLTQDVYATDMTLSNGVTVKAANWRIFCSGTLTVGAGSVISCDGGDASGVTAGTGVPAGFFPASLAGAAGVTGNQVGNVPSSDATARQIGGTGGPGASAAGNIFNYSSTPATPNIPAAADGGWRVAETFPVAAAGRFSPAGAVPQGFSGGTGGSSGSLSSAAGNSGGGGGGGGVLYVAANTIVNSGAIHANGGKGGNATKSANNAGGGGGGGGGAIILIYASKSGAGTITADGGAGGTSDFTTAAGSVNAVSVAMNSAINTYSPTRDTAASRYVAVPLRGQTNATPPTIGFLLLFVMNQRGGGSPNQPTVTGWGMTWTPVASVTWNTIAAPQARLTLYSSPAGIVTVDQLWKGFVFDFGGQVQDNMLASVDYWQQIHSSGQVVQSATNRADSSASITVTLAAFSDVNNPTYQVTGLAQTTESLTVGAGFNFGAGQSVTTVALVQSEVQQANDTTADQTVVSPAAIAAIAVELKANTGAIENGGVGQPGQIITFQA